MPRSSLHKLPLHGDHRGRLVALEGGASVPFDIARVYYVFGTEPGVARGAHAHREVRQLAVCVSGSCRMLLDDGRGQAWVDLDAPDLGLFMDTMVWHEMHDFSPDCVLLVMASGPYDEADYIRDRAEFDRLAASGAAG